MNICAKAPFCCFQSQSEVFRPDGSCVAMKSVVSCMKQSVAAAQQDFRLKKHRRSILFYWPGRRDSTEFIHNHNLLSTYTFYNEKLSHVAFSRIYSKRCFLTEGHCFVAASEC